MFKELKNQKSSYSVSGNSDCKGEYSHMGGRNKSVIIM
jgi:hypothetical protein